MDPVITVISCVAAVISAFHSGAKIIQSIKARRQARQAAPILTELERSVGQAPGEIEAETQKGVQRFGKAFEQGDYIAILAIQQVTIDIQNNLLEKLRKATIDDEVTDFTTLTDESDIGRNKIKTALTALYLRLYEGTKIPNIPALTYPVIIPQSAISPQSSFPKEQTKSVVKITAQEVHDGTLEGNKLQSQHTRKWSLSKLRRSSKSQSEHPQQSEHGCNSLALDQNNTTVTSLPTPPSRHTTQALNIRYEAGEDDWSKVWGDESTDSFAENANDLSVQFQSARRNIQVPTPDNKFLGLCKAAWKLQNGDRKALRMTNCGQTSQFSGYYFVCGSCSYKCLMNEDSLWHKVRTLAPRGIQFRWSFLAKSHIPHKNPAVPNYSYLCLFCIFLGCEAQPWKLEALFEHISSEHRGANLGEVVLNRTNCVDDHICGEEEIFDINLWPVTSSDDFSFRRASLTSTLTTSSTSTGKGWESVISRVVDA